MANYSRHIKRQLGEWMTEAYERELARELDKLDQAFAEWRAGQISSGELSERVHRYDVGPSRELSSRYNDLPHATNVAYAVVAGILKEEELPSELLEAIAPRLNVFRQMQREGELKEPGV